MLAWLQACINWLCKQGAWLFAKRVRLNNSSVDVGPVLAEGGFATVYEAIDVRTKRAIAVKQIRCPDADHAARADADAGAGSVAPPARPSSRSGVMTAVAARSGRAT